VINCSPNF